MSKKIFSILAFIAISVSLATILPAKTEARIVTGVGWGWPGSYYAEFRYCGNLKPEDNLQVTAYLREAYAEYENPNGRRVLVGVGGVDNISGATAPGEIIGTDDAGCFIIRVYFPDSPGECSSDPDISCPVYDADGNLLTTDEQRFLEFYGLEPYKDNWALSFLYVEQVNINGIITYAINGHTFETGLYDCITNAIYRDGVDNWAPDYICVVSGSPFAIDDFYTMKKDVFSGNVTDNDFDREGDPLTASLYWNDTNDDGVCDPTEEGCPANGTLTLNSDGSFTYTQTDPPNFQEDHFTYIVNDGTYDSNVATVTLKSFK